MLRRARHAVVLLLPACFNPVYGHTLCGSGNTCPNGLSCSPISGVCEPRPGGDDAGIDGSPDAPPDARLCFGTAPFTVCLAAPPSGTIDVAMPTTFDTVIGTVTGTVLNCAPTTSGGASYCVLAADTITVDAPLRAIGANPLVLVAATSINVPLSGSIDVGSRRTMRELVGAGADPASGCHAGVPPTTANGNSGGGAGGSFIGVGGNGGDGGAVAGTGGLRGAASAIGTVIRGGCPGQDGDGGGKGARGHGGGAVFLIAGSTITVSGTIDAGGEGGNGGAAPDAGGGGGGAGGMIGLDATAITVTGALSANGGGGGEGGGASLTGAPGMDASSTTVASGGGKVTIGGDGGDGSAGSVTTGTTGTDAGTSGGGGGGGGGGAGLIKGPASLGGHASPAATP